MLDEGKYVRITGGNFGIRAEYTEQKLKEYMCNPLIESLPPILSEDEVIDQLSFFPEFNFKERELSASYRYHVISRLFSYFQPFNKHIDLEQRISRVIRQGYIARNPFWRHQAEWQHHSYQALKKGQLVKSAPSDFRRTAIGFTMLGISGIGKTTAIDQVLSLYPQVIIHSKYMQNHFNLFQLSWLKIDCPFDGSIKGMCVAFFAKIDELLGTNYFKKFGSRSNSTDTMLQHMNHLARLHAIGVLIIDEIQHLSLARSGGSDKMLNFFVTLVNTIGVPVILIGTNKAVSILQSEFRQARRGSGQGDMIWNQMPKDEMWDLFIEGMWEFQWTKNTTILTKEINDLLYEESQGILDIAKKLYMISQLRAINTGKEKITSRLIKQVASDSFKLVQPMMKALKSGNPLKIAEYEDIRPIDYDEFVEQYRETIDLKEQIRQQKIIESKKRKKQTSSLKEKVVVMLLNLDVEAEKAQELTERAIKTLGIETKPALIVNEVLNNLNQVDNNQKQRKQKNTNKKDKRDLRFLLEKGRKEKLSAYEIFLDFGIIKNDYEDAG
ncbi:ATP-binding protein [Guptibacillus hwajinpoensis]|uniref:ATPase AAA n=1 Tax=Guptibacillus hwajinpoensis TaxID=208199 RepID=A0A0J6CTD3_9BACL|nr:ATP-binding protein [Alkalihalobacillus macyae]KMM36355.1 ATPase AAA [Alkalihalobacillus macyae]